MVIDVNRRMILQGLAAASAHGFFQVPAFAQTTQTRTIKNEFPWQDSPDAVACNFALGHLVANVPRSLTVNGRIHAETYVSAVGAIAGFTAQRTLFAANPPVVGTNINRAAVASGDQFWFGDNLNYMLIPRTRSEGNRRVWSLALGGALTAGLPRGKVPKLGAMFKFVASTIGGVNEGRSSVPQKHQAKLPARDLLKAVWPVATRSFTGTFPGASREFPSAPVNWWSAIAAQASSRPIQNVKGVLPPDIALILLMETAIYCSKLDQSGIEGE